MTNEFEEEVFEVMDDLRGDNRVAVPDVGTIRRRAGQQQNRMRVAAGAACVAVVAAIGLGVWVMGEDSPGATETAGVDADIADDGLDAVAEDSAPVEIDGSPFADGPQPVPAPVEAESGDASRAVELTADSWQALTPMLTPRSNALGVWTGLEVIIVGGDSVTRCPAYADCADPGRFPQLTDGAAFNPSTNQWRKIADSPVPIGLWSSTAIVGSHMYVSGYPLSIGSARPVGTFLRYNIADDEWTALPAPSDTGDWYQLLAFGGKVIGYDTSDEQGERLDRLFDPETEVWSDLPPDPLSPSYDRFMVVEGDEVFLFGKDIVPSPGLDGPSLAKIARLQPETGDWEVLGEAEALWTSHGVLVDGHIVFPWTGEVRSYPHGGVWDLADQTWSSLPEQTWSYLPEPGWETQFAVAGVVGGSQAAFRSAVGPVLDLDDNTWTELPPLPDAELGVTSRTVVSVGQDLFVFGGEYWTDNVSGTQLGSAYAISTTK